MGRQGFIFSLDAFVAFTLTMITVGILIFTIGTPKPYYPSLEQAHQLAHDTLQVLATSTDSPLAGTYLEQIIGGTGDTGVIMLKVAGGIETAPRIGGDYYRPIIPKGYGYKLEKYNFNDDTWSTIYDAGTDGCSLGSDRCGKKFTKLQASATTFASLYTVNPRPGESPYCYLSCRGYQGPGSYATPCNVTPCDIPISNFLAGNNSIAIVRFTVYT